MSVYLLTCIFCRWFGYNLLAGTLSSPVQPVLQQLSRMAGVFYSWILALVGSSRSEVTGWCLCYLLMQLGCFKTKLLAGKRRGLPHKGPLPTWQQVPLVKGSWDKVFTKSWNNEKARESRSMGYLLKILFLSSDYPKTWFCIMYLLKKCGVWGF